MKHVDVIGVHGFPLDWNHWHINEWPDRIAEAREVSGKPVWVLEVGASSFGAEEVQAFGFERTLELLSGRVERIHWYSLFDLPPTWPAETRHKEAEGSSYYRHYYLGLVKSDGTPKLAAKQFPTDGSVGLCQWFHFEDPRLDDAVRWMRDHGVRHLRTGLSWADSFRPNAIAWFDRMMQALEPFEVSLTLCFTPAHLGLEEHHTSPPKQNQDFADFAAWAVERYASTFTMARKTEQQEGVAAA
jgi:beta-xylosidase